MAKNNVQKIIIFLLFSFSVFGYNASLLITDEDFTNQRFCTEDVRRFVRKNFINCKLTDQELKQICYVAWANKISALVILSKLQQESSLVENNVTNNYDFRKEIAMGCRVYSYHTKKPRYKYRGFYNQIYWGTYILRFYFEDYEYGNEIILEDKNMKKVWPQNAASYALYIYCPSFGKVDSHPWLKEGQSFIGNSVFADVFERYKKIWISMFGGY